MTATHTGRGVPPQAESAPAVAGAVSDPMVLAAELDRLHQQRLADERTAAQLPPLLRAIAQVRRDRDAGTSPEMKRHRTQLERAWADAEDLIFTMVRVGLLIHLRGGDDSDPVVHRARRAIDGGQAALGVLFETVTEDR